MLVLINVVFLNKTSSVVAGESRPIAPITVVQGVAIESDVVSEGI